MFCEYFQGLLCYEEDISLLTEKHEWMKEQCEARLKGLLTEANQELRGSTGITHNIMQLIIYQHCTLIEIKTIYNEHTLLNSD